MRPFLVALCAALAFGCKKSEPPPSAAPSATKESAPAAPAGAAPASRASAAAGPAAPPEPPKPAGPLNVLLILVDSLRADMPWAGYPRAIAPNLTALEKQSVSYTRGYSVSSYTAKSVAALLGGQLPSTLKRSGYFFTKYPESNLFFPELLQAAGVTTLSVQAHQYMKPKGNGLDQGFTRWEIVKGITFDAQTDKHVTSDKLTPLAIELLQGAPPDKPFFMYLHYMDPHDQYIRHEDVPDFGRRIRDLYDGEVFFTDRWIGKLLEFCRAEPWWQNTAVIVSADHGEAFGEHGMHRHAFELWNALTHVPLFVHLPGATPRRIDTPRSAIDLAPTVLELMQVPADPILAGKSLVAELRGAEPEPRPVILDLPADSNNPERRALIHGDWKLLVFGANWRYDLYNLAQDPEEKKNLAKTEPDKLAELKQLDEQLWSRFQKVKPFGGNTLQGGGKATGPAQ